jgi:branched-chain amino acid transport system permease protein
VDQLIQQLINGLSLGSIYALIALGYTMIYGIIQLINFAHGDIYMIGAFVGFFSMTVFDLGFFESILAAMIVCVTLGVLIERVAYKPLRGSTRIAVLITAIGMSLLLEYTMVFLVGAQVRSYPQMPGFMNATYTFGSITISSKQILIIAISIALMIGLQFIVKQTKIGKAMRAVSSDADAAQLMGISVDRTIAFTFAIGSALAGAAGVLVGVYYNSINPLMGILPGLKAFVAAVVGGIGIIPGAMLGAYLIGAIETIVSALGYSMLREAVVFATLIIILIVKPAGLLGQNVKEKV